MFTIPLCGGAAGVTFCTGESVASGHHVRRASKRGAYAVIFAAIVVTLFVSPTEHDACTQAGRQGRQC
jgi:hypothetical protein